MSTPENTVISSDTNKPVSNSRKFMDALMEINDIHPTDSALFDDNKPNDIEEMFINANKSKNSLDDLATVISTLGLMLNKNVRSVSMLYRLNDKNIKIKIKES